MRTIVFGNTMRKEVVYFAAKLLTELRKKRSEIICQSDFVSFLLRHNVDVTGIERIDDYTNLDADIAFSVGGDGTFIRAVAKIAKKEIPIIGINAGRLGFLADISGDNEITEAVDKVYHHRYTEIERTLLKLSTDEHKFNDFNYAINEIAILKQDTSSMIAINAYINDFFLNRYQADGLIIATSTGSTAYSMSVGGPIISPACHSIIIIPVAPHSLNMRPIVVPDDVELRLTVESRNHHFLIALDGRSNVFEEGTELRIKRASRTLKTIRLEGHSFFNTLKEKLMWGSDNRRY